MVIVVAPRGEDLLLPLLGPDWPAQYLLRDVSQALGVALGLVVDLGLVVALEPAVAPAQVAAADPPAARGRVALAHSVGVAPHVAEALGVAPMPVVVLLRLAGMKVAAACCCMTLVTFL